MYTPFPLAALGDRATPYYFYDLSLLRETLSVLLTELRRYPGFTMHYAIKANANASLLRVIAATGIGADCVSGGEIEAAVRAGFHSEDIVFAGVGKADWEIRLAIEHNIGCFNVESVPELEVINALAGELGATARVALRLNPDVSAHTHKHITTGLAENKFGIPAEDMLAVIALAQAMEHIELIGLHFHIGSQIVDMGDYVALCERVNALQDVLQQHGITIDNINVGGGLGINYESPDVAPIAPFADYLATVDSHLRRSDRQRVHFELGRAIVAQCGSLITRVLYVKRGTRKTFCIVDAGMTELIRPALYHAHHAIEALTHSDGEDTYDVVGPICESSDVFAKDLQLPTVRRGDLIAIRSAGAYGEAMASHYNCRHTLTSITSEEI